jgi:hypothetical protein
LDVPPRNCTTVLPEDVKEDEEVAGASVEDSVERPTGVTTKLAQGTVHL